MKPRKAESGFSAQIIKKLHTTLESLFQYAFEIKWLDEKPTTIVTAPKTKPTKQRILIVEERIESNLLIDSTIVRAHACSSEAQKNT